MIRSNKNAKVIEEFKSIQESDIDFVNDHCNLLLGICFNNTGEHATGERYLKLAIEGFEARDASYHLFTALFNLFILMSNLGKISDMERVLKRMEKIDLSETLAKVRLLRCQFIYACDSNNNDEAYALIKKINKIKADFSESDIAQHLVCEFMFYVKQEELKKAESVLEEIKQYRNYSTTENFIFMKRLLSHLTDDTTIYIYEREFSITSFLYHQLKVIEALQSQNSEEALKFWNKLQKKDSHLYEKDFKYLGEKCLFSLCLDKHLKQAPVPALEIISGKGSLQQRLYQVLLESKVPLSKGYLFELLWGELPEEKVDFLRLAKVISKVRTIYKVEIISRKGTYFISDKEQKSAKTS